MLSILELPAKVSCIALLIFQGMILDFYLVKVHNIKWVAFVIADVIVICIWIFSFAVAIRFFKKKKDEIDAGKRPEDCPDGLPFAFAAWIAYAVLLIPRVAAIFERESASKLKEKDFFGPNTLKAGVACTPLIFVLLVYGHHDSKPHTIRKYYIQSLVGSVAFDIFDSLDLLEFLFMDREEHKFPIVLSNAILAFACINIFLPTLALIELKFNNFSGQVSPLSFKVLYSAAFVCLVNVPNLIIRSVLWHKYNTDVSVLLMKNVMCIVIGIAEIFEYAGEDRPVKCPKCGKWHLSHFSDSHRSICRKRIAAGEEEETELSSRISATVEAAEL
eukprot:gene6143-6849_t